MSGLVCFPGVSTRCVSAWPSPPAAECIVCTIALYHSRLSDLYCLCVRACVSRSHLAAPSYLRCRASARRGNAELHGSQNKKKTKKGHLPGQGPVPPGASVVLLATDPVARRCRAGDQDAAPQPTHPPVGGALGRAGGSPAHEPGQPGRVHSTGRPAPPPLPPGRRLGRLLDPRPARAPARRNAVSVGCSASRSPTGGQGDYTYTLAHSGRGACLPGAPSPPTATLGARQRVPRSTVRVPPLAPPAPPAAA